MTVFVSVERGLDCHVKPAVKADGAGIDLSNVKMRMKPSYEIGAVSIGEIKVLETVRTASLWTLPARSGSVISSRQLRN